MKRLACSISFLWMSGLLLAGAAGAQYKVWIPDILVEKASDGKSWGTSIYVKNDSSSNAQIQFQLYYRSGGRFSLLPHEENQTLKSRGRTFLRLANSYGGRLQGWVTSNKPISVVAIHLPKDRASYAAYEGIDNAKVDSNPLVPLVYKSYDGYNSRLVLQNTGSNGVWVTLEFRSNGTSYVTHSRSEYLPGNGAREVSVGGIGQLGGSFRGNVRIVNGSGRKLAVVTLHERGSGGRNTLMASSHSHVMNGNWLWAPLMHKQNYGWESGITIQNGAWNAQQMVVAQYKSGGLDDWWYRWVEGYSTETIDPGDWLWPSVDPPHFSWGTFGGTSDKSAVVRQFVPGTNLASAYSTINDAAKTVSLPYFFSGDSSFNFDTGFVIQNVSGSYNTVTVEMYKNEINQSGQLLKVHSITLAPWAAGIVWDWDLPAGTHGSAVVKAQQPVTAMVNVMDNGSSSDKIFTYSGNPR